MTASTPICHSYLLSIPTELRLQIYDYCLEDANTITLTAAPLTVFGHTIKDRACRKPISGLPDTHCPLVRYCYDPVLLSIPEPPTISLDNGTNPNANHERLPYPTPLALSQTCRFIKEELGDYMRRRPEEKAGGGLSLYVTYPYGILVLKELYPFILRQAKNVYISGYYITAICEVFEPERPRPDPTVTASYRPKLRLGPPRFIKSGAKFPRHDPMTAETAPKALAELVRQLLSPVSPPNFRKLEARILYPGMFSYNTIWEDDKGPIPRVLYNICGGGIEMETSRGDGGNAVALTARPNPKTRNLHASWRKLGRSMEAMKEFVIGEKWGEDV